MTQKIDKRIVEMSFDNKHFENNVSGSLGTIDKLKKALNFDGVGKSFGGISDAASRVNLGPLGSAASSVGLGFSAMAVVGITALVNLTNAAINAGKNIANALVVKPITLGLQEYETKLNSIQTILANTQKEGTTLEQVTGVLNDLNDYSDKTIYNFGQMARNIGTFTAAGVKLEDSAAAIKGIANLAALSGSNAEQASTAMYQLSQALSSGVVRLMDWNSVANAGMGGTVFQDAIVETARVHGVAIDDILAQEGGFRNSLQTGWLSSEILTESLQKFTGDLSKEQLTSMGYTEEQIAGIEKMAKVANDAAQKVKTFSQLMGTLAETAQSGWAQTWEMIIGDFEEAKVFMTDLNNFFGGLIGASAKARNELVAGWDALGGRTKLIEAFQHAINAVVTAINPLIAAFKEIFPPATAQQLFNITAGLATFIKKLILSADKVEKVKRIFKGLFAFFDIIKMAVSAVAKEFGRLLGFLAPAGGGLLDLTAKFGDFLLRVRDAIKANDLFGTIMRRIGDTILLVAAAIGKGIEAVSNFVKKFKELKETQNFLKAFAGGFAAFFDSFKNLDFGILQGFIDKIKERFGSIGDAIKNAFGGGGVDVVTPFERKLAEIGKNVKKALGKLVMTVMDAIAKIDFTKIKFDSVFDNINKGLLAGLILTIQGFIRKGGGVFGSISKIFDGMGGFVENASGILASISTVLTGVKDIFIAYQQQIRANILKQIAISIGILAASLLVLSLIDSKKLTASLAAVTGLFANLLGSMAIYEKVSGGAAGIPAMAKGIAVMLGLATSVLLLSGALALISKIDTKDLTKGLVAIAALTGILVLTATALSKSSGLMARGAISMIVYSLALRTLIGPLKSLGAMDGGDIAKGLTALGLLFAEITLFLKGMKINTSALDDMLGLVLLGAAISDLSGIITAFAQQDSSALLLGLSTLGIVLAQLIAFGKLSSNGGNFILTAAGMVILSQALLTISDVVANFGSMSMDEVATGLTALGGSLLILGIAMNAMTSGIAGAAALVVAAAAIAILTPSLKVLGSMSLEQIGIGLLALAGAFTIIGVAGAVLTPVVPTLLLLGVALGLLGVAALGVGLGIGVFAAGVGVLVAALAALATVGAAGGLAIAGILVSLSSVLPALAAGFALAIISFAKVITGGSGTIFEAAKTLMLGFIRAVTETIPDVAVMMLTFIDTMLATIAENIPSITQSGYAIIIGILEGMRDNFGEITNVAVDIVTTYLNALAERVPELVLAGHNLIISFIDGLTASVEDNMPRLMESVRKLALEIIRGLLVGLVEGQAGAVGAIQDLGNSLVEAFKKKLGIASPSTVFIALALDIIRGLVNGLINNLGLIGDAAIRLVNQLVTTVVSKVGSMSTAGKDLVIGLANGIRDHISSAVRAAGDLARSVLNSISGIFDSNSPSRMMMDQGKFLDQGLALGITQFSGVVNSATKKLGTDALSGFKSVISGVNDSLNTDMNFQPTIRPVLDMTAIQSGSSQIKSILGVPTLDVGVGVIKAASIGVGNTSDTASAETVAKQPEASTMNFTQNNYSPKELSRLEIYRQTKNQLLQVKGLTGVQ